MPERTIQIEEGDLSDALERLRRAQDRLSEAIENGATDEEIAQLIIDLDDDDFQIREKATEKLITLRPAVDAKLKASLKGASIEAQPLNISTAQKMQSALFIPDSSGRPDRHR